MRDPSREIDYEREHDRDLLLAVLGHDLRNPLSSILSGLNLLHVGRLDERERVLVEQLQAAALRMSHMTDQLLDFGRSQLSGGRHERALVDLGEVSDRVIGELDAAGKAAVMLKRLGDARGMWDRDGMARVIANLVGNALAHGDRAPVALLVDGRNNDVDITCHNTGPAIDAETLTHLFDPFTRGARSSGLGLGLYIVARIVEGHDGRITVRSTPRAGTTFTVRLPRRSFVQADTSKLSPKPFAPNGANQNSAEDST
jgi:signal transduction histidine kinase